MTRLRFLSNAGSGGGGGGGPGGDTVRLGPEFGEADLNAFTLDPSWTSMRLGPFGNDLTLNPNVDQLRMGPFGNDMTLSVPRPALALSPPGNDIRLSVASSLVLADLNPFADFQTKENAPTTNYGTVPDIGANTNSLTGNDEEYSYLVWDLTGYAGTVITAATIHVETYTTALLATTGNFDLRTIATQPYVESTANWNNVEPPVGTSRQTGTFSVPTTPTNADIVLDATARANMPGNWVILRVSASAPLHTAYVLIRTKEFGTASSRPRLDLTVTVTT